MSIYCKNLDSAFYYMNFEDVEEILEGNVLHTSIECYF